MSVGGGDMWLCVCVRVRAFLFCEQRVCEIYGVCVCVCVCARARACCVVVVGGVYLCVVVAAGGGIFFSENLSILSLAIFKNQKQK